tara:strand:- start:908 stop:1090 length:183 start_codon:yes stop_codon:yes gene_type:complete
MKKYKITFTNEKIKRERDIELVKKFKGKELTLIDLEKVIIELGEIIFDGDTIEVYNDYRE